MLPHFRNKGRYVCRYFGERESEIYFLEDGGGVIQFICKVDRDYASALRDILQKAADDYTPPERPTVDDIIKNL